MLQLDPRLAACLSGRYTIERELGRGGMAVVYLAQDVRHSRSVAIKVLRPELAASIGADRFLREIGTLSRLAHPHILPLLDSGDGKGLLYYVMPYVEGETLRARLDRERQLPVDEAVRIAREVAGVLDYAHRQHVLHRDIKPENILLEDGQAVVADFGVARAIGQALHDPPDDSTGPMHTATGVSLGTPVYMSPEQAAGERTLDGRSDIYALGCVTYEMLAGEPPFTGASTESVTRQHLLAEPPDIMGVRAAVPTHVGVAIRRALEKTPADRFARASEFGAALGSSAVERHPANARRQNVLPWAVAASVVVAAGVAWALARPTFEEQPADATPPPHTILAEVTGSAPAEIRSAVQNLIAIRLNQSGILRTVPAGDLERGYALAGLPDTTRLGVRTARELAFRGSIRTVILATVDQLGSTFALTVQVLNAEDGDVVVAEAARAQGEDRIIPTVGQVVDEVRDRLGERRGQIRANQSIEAVATPSFEAFQHYVRAVEHNRRDPDNEGCLRELRLALAADPEFAHAWSLLGFCHSNWGAGDSALVAWQRAWELRHRLTTFTRVNLEGILAAARDGDAATTLRIFERGDRLLPGRFAHNLAVILAEEFARYEEAAALHAKHRENSAFGPTRLELMNGARTLIPLGRFAEAESLHLQIPAQARSPMVELSFASARHDWDALERAADSYRSDPSSTQATRAYAASALAGAHAARGRLERARQVLRGETEDLRAAGEVRYGNPAIRADRASWLVALMAESVNPSGAPDQPGMETRTWQGIMAAYGGDSARAVALLRDARTRRETSGLGARKNESFAMALVDTHRGRHERVVARLAPDASFQLMVERWWLLANAHARLGQPDSSALYLERLVADSGVFGDGTISVLGIVYPFARFCLAMHYAERGQRELAQKHYLAFLDTFTQPDPEFAWMVTEARTELARLSEER